MKIFTFCTCCAHNQQKYAERVRKWRTMLKTVQSGLDFFCICNGEVTAHLPPDVRKITLNPALDAGGRGQARSYVTGILYAQLMGYKKIFFCENDDVIVNYNNVMSHFRESGNYSSWCDRYNFLEGTFQVINDPAALDDVIAYYLDYGITGESLLSVLRQYAKFEYAFKSARIDGKKADTTGLDFTAQSY